MKAPVKPKTG